MQPSSISPATASISPNTPTAAPKSKPSRQALLSRASPAHATDRASPLHQALPLPRQRHLQRLLRPSPMALLQAPSSRYRAQQQQPPNPPVVRPLPLQPQPQARQRALPQVCLMLPVRAVPAGLMSRLWAGAWCLQQWVCY